MITGSTLTRNAHECSSIIMGTMMSSIGTSVLVETGMEPRPLLLSHNFPCYHCHYSNIRKLCNTYKVT